MIPPLERTISPVIEVLVAEHKKTIGGTTSSGSRMRRIGELCSTCRRRSSGTRPAMRSVRVKPGITTLEPKAVKKQINRVLVPSRSVILVQGPAAGVKNVIEHNKITGETKLPDVIHDEDED